MIAEVSKAVKWPKRIIVYELRSWRVAVVTSRQGWPSSKRKHDVSVIGHSVSWQWIKSESLRVRNPEGDSEIHVQYLSIIHRVVEIVDFFTQTPF